MSTLAAPTTWPGRASLIPQRAGFGPTLRFELVKMLSPWRIRGFLLACLLGPALFVAVVNQQASLPSDTVFGRWMHQSGWAGSLVVLSFACSWVLPLLACLVAGDAFACEDRFGTWRHLLLAVRSPERIFAAKALASVLVAEAMVALLALSSVAGGVLFAGDAPLVGLDGQPLAPGRAALLVVLAWLYVALASLAWAGVGLLGSVLLGRSPMGLLLPAVLALVLQLCQLLPLPVPVRMALPSQAFLAWRGLFTQPVQAGPLVVGLLVALAWAALATALARRAFLRSTFAQPAGDGGGRPLLLALAPLAALSLAAAGLVAVATPAEGRGISQPKVEQAMATSFAHLYRQQTLGLNRPDVTEQQLGTTASCTRGADVDENSGPGNDWRCVVSWHLPGARAVGSANYQLQVAPDGRIVADGDGPAAVNGFFLLRTPHGTAVNPTWQVDSLVDLLAAS